MLVNALLLYPFWLSLHDVIIAAKYSSIHMCRKDELDVMFANPQKVLQPQTKRRNATIGVAILDKSRNALFIY